MRPTAVLFDLDCTLTDRAATMREFARRFASEFPSTVKDRSLTALTDILTAADANGYRPKDERAAYVLEHLYWDHTPDLETLSQFWTVEFARSTQPADHMVAVLDALRTQNLQLGIVTNGSAYQLEKVRVLGIESYMQTVAVSAIVGSSKPDPRIFLHALEAVQCQPSQAWFVGDHPVNDVMGATTVGMIGVWKQDALPWPSDCPSPRLVITALNQLLDLLEEGMSPK